MFFFCAIDFKDAPKQSGIFIFCKSSRQGSGEDFDFHNPPMWQFALSLRLFWIGAL
jgi:hypothetical protein